MRKARKTAKRATKRATSTPTQKRRQAASPKKAGRPRRSTEMHPRKTTRSKAAGTKTAGRQRRRNPGELEAAAALSEKFHGRPAHRVAEYDEPNDSPRTLAELGGLRSLTVDTPNAERIELTFGRGVKLAANPASGSLYIVGGDQSLDLAAIGLDDEAGKDQTYIGEVQTVMYNAKKGFHDFESIDYVHEFGEEGGRRPRLNYDTTNERLHLSGGSYQIKPEGITD